MTRLGGRDVARVCVLAGFTGDAIKHAQLISYAATRWDDAYQWDPPGHPAGDQWGLFATWPATSGLADPRDLFNPETSAKDAHRLWTDDGDRWDWHPVWRSLGLAGLGALWRELDVHNLWTSETRDHGLPVVALPTTRGPRWLNVGR